MINLYELWERMNKHGKNSIDKKSTGGMLERYQWFINNSNMGDSCTYAKKCLDLFLREDYEDIKKLFLECLKEFRSVEGDNFGK
jgi:hypothetical protein